MSLAVICVELGQKESKQAETSQELMDNLKFLVLLSLINMIDNLSLPVNTFIKISKYMLLQVNLVIQFFVNFLKNYYLETTFPH